MNRETSELPAESRSDNQPKQDGVKPSLGIGRVNTAFACSGLKQAPKTVLVYLALRYREDKGCSWVSIGNMAHACSMSVATVKRALKVLCDPSGGTNLLTRSLRDESVTKSRKTEIHWDRIAERASVFRPALAPIPAPTKFSKEDLAKVEAVLAPDPARTTAGGAAKSENATDALLDALLAVLRGHLGTHRHFREKDDDGVLRGCLRGCIQMSGNGAECLSVLTWVCESNDNEGIRKAILTSDRLGGYLKKCFPGWLEKFQASQPTEETRHPAPIRSKVQVNEAGSGDAEHFPNTDAGWVAWMLTNCVGRHIDPARFEGHGSDLGLRELCQWAVNDEGWAQCFAEAPDPTALFLEQLEEISEQYSQQSGARGAAEEVADEDDDCEYDEDPDDDQDDDDDDDDDDYDYDYDDDDDEDRDERY